MTTGANFSSALGLEGRTIAEDRSERLFLEIREEICADEAEAALGDSVGFLRRGFLRELLQVAGAHGSDEPAAAFDLLEKCPRLAGEFVG